MVNDSGPFNLDEMCKAALTQLNREIRINVENHQAASFSSFHMAMQRMHWRHDDLVCLFNARFRHARKQLLRAHYPTNPGERK